MEELLCIFDLYDVKHTGAIVRSDILKIIRSAGVPISNKDAEAWILTEANGSAPSPASKGGNAAAAAAASRDISNQLMTREEFQRFCAEKDFVSKVITAKMTASGVKYKAQSDVMAALQAFDYKEHGYLTLSEVTNILITMNEKLTGDEVTIALRDIDWFDGDGTTSQSKVRLNDLARHLTRHYSQVSILNEEVLSIVK